MAFADDGEVAEDLADRAGELEPMAGARTGDEDLRMGGMMIDPEMFIRRVRVKADGSGAEMAVGLREVAAQEPAHRLHFSECHVAGDEIRRDV